MTFKQCLFTYLDQNFDMSDSTKIILMAGLILLCVAIPYMLGSLNFAVIISKLIYHDDIRKYGSKNAGTTNMLRTYGKGAAAFTLIGDMAKCAVAVVFGALLWIDGAYIAGLFCVVGHAFPCWYGFKGGKGMASTAMVALLISPGTFLILLVVFVIIVLTTKYVSLASVMCALLYPVFLASLNNKGINVIMAFLLMVIVVFMHRGNIKRIIDKTEPKLELGKKKSNPQEMPDNDDDGSAANDNDKKDDNNNGKKGGGKA